MGCVIVLWVIIQIVLQLMKISANSTNIKIQTNTATNRQDRRVTKKILDQSQQPSTITKTSNTNTIKTATTTSNTTTSTNIQQQYQQSNTNNNNKIQACLRTISQLQQTTSKLQSQLQYYNRVEQWLKTSLTNSQQKNQTNLKSLMTANAKLTILEKQAIFAATKPTAKQTPVTNNNSNSNNNNKCSMSAHLNYVLSSKTANKQKIGQLLKTRQQLYRKIQATLIKQQPYLHQKIMKKIRKEIRKQTKLQAIAQLKKIIKQKQSWLKTAKQQISDKIDDKIIEQKLTNNLQKMKQVMNKKILNDQYICELTSNQNNIDRNLQKFNRAGKQAIIMIKNQLKNMTDNVEQQLELLQRVKLVKTNNVQFDQIFMEEINNVIKEGESYLVQPLGSNGTAQLQEQYERLEQQINKLTNKIY